MNAAAAARRAEDLSWYRAGFAAGRASAQREHTARDDYERSVEQWQQDRHADQQARVESLLHEVIGVLADGLVGRSPSCARCRRAHRSCQHSQHRPARLEQAA